MRIRTLLLSAVFVTFLMLLGLAVASWVIAARLAEDSQAQNQAQSVAREVSELLVLTHEYALYSEERAAQQWRTRQATIVALLEAGSGATVPSPPQAIADAKLLADIFQNLVDASAGNTSLQRRQKALLLDQLLASSQNLTDAVYRWGKATYRHHQGAEDGFRTLSIVIPLLMLMVLLLMALLMYRRVLAPLATLHKAVAAVAQGDLTIRSAITARDELGDLSRTFDAMAVDMVTQLRQEITERKQTESALQASELRFRSMLERIPAVAIQGYARDGTTRFWNQASEQLYGYSAEEAIGRNLLELIIPPEMRDTVRHGMDEMFDTGQPIPSGELSLMRKDGTRVDVISSHAYVHIPGKAPEMFCVDFDLSERRQAEEELKRSNAELEQFSYAISHDMRQPLRMIASYLQLLEKELGDRLDKDRREYLDFAKDGAKRLDKMLVGLLEYSRVGRKGEPPALVESRILLDEALLFLQPAIAEAQASIRIEGEWPKIFVSPDEVLRLIQNLIGNAIKFRIAGRPPEVTVTSEILGKSWRMCVTDNGVGIPPEQIVRLFQVFQRLQSRADYEGTGLGLALCRKIAEHHGGRIWAESAGTGQGCRFCVTLPQAHFENSSTPN